MSGNREMTSAELVDTFEREAGEPWFSTLNDGRRMTHVSPPYPGIVPTWPRLIRERAASEAVNSYGDLKAALLHVTMRRHEHSDDCDGCLTVQRMVRSALSEVPSDAR